MLNKLFRKRTQVGYSTMHISRNLGISKTFYWQIEKNQRRLSYDMAVKIAKIFKLKPDDIFYDDFKKNIK